MATYSEDFKRDAVAELQRTGDSPATVAKRLGCSSSALRTWRDGIEEIAPLAHDPLRDVHIVNRTKTLCGLKVAEGQRLVRPAKAEEATCAECRSAAGIDDAASSSTSELYDRGARVLQVFGPFASQTLIEMPTRLAQELFGDALAIASPSRVAEGVENDINKLASASSELGNSALAGTARALAREIENPYNSATSKASCAGQLREALDRLRELAPPEEEKDGVDALRASRDERRAGSAAT